MPRLWARTIDAHRQAVREAALDTAAALVARQGLRAVTMSQIAEETGIGRATLYKYFPNVEAILLAWHERQVGEHAERIAEMRRQAGNAGRRLAAVLEAYGLIQHSLRTVHGPHAAELAAHLHQVEHVARAREELAALVRDLIAEGAQSGEIRDDVAPVELASYCLHALLAASRLSSRAAVRRLVTVTLAGLRPDD